MLVLRSGGSDLHWLVVRFRGDRPLLTAGRSLSREPSPPPLQTKQKTIGVTAIGVTAIGVTTIGVTTIGVTAIGVTAIGVTAIGVTTIGVTAIGVTVEPDTGISCSFA